MLRLAVALASFVAACGPTVVDDLGGATSSGATAESSASGVYGTTTTTTTSGAGDSTGGVGDGSSTGGDDPPPSGGLEPWGYAFEVLDDIVAAEVLLADFDGDGHVDVFTQGSLTSGAALVQVWLGTGSGIEGVAFGIASESTIDWQARPSAGDWDGDGDVDAAAFATYADDTFFVSLNDGDAGFPSSIPVTGAGLFPGFGVAVLDTNSDGLDDLMIPGGHSSGGYVYASAGGGAFAEAAVVPQPACYFSASAVADFDDDGIADLASTGSCNQVPEALPLFVYRGDGSGLAVEQMFFEGAGVLEGGDLVAVDLDDDGDSDLVTGVWPSGLTILRNDAGVLAPPELRENRGEGLAATIVPARLDAGPVAVVLQDPSGVAAIVEHVDVARIAATPVDLQGRLVGGADFNEDGRTDLAVLVGGDTVGTLAIWYSE